MVGKYYGSASAGHHFTELDTWYRNNQLDLRQLWNQGFPGDSPPEFYHMIAWFELDGMGEFRLGNVSLVDNSPSPLPPCSLTDENWVYKRT